MNRHVSPILTFILVTTITKKAQQQQQPADNKATTTMSFWRPKRKMEQRRLGSSDGWSFATSTSSVSSLPGRSLRSRDNTGTILSPITLPDLSATTNNKRGANVNSEEELPPPAKKKAAGPPPVRRILVESYDVLLLQMVAALKAICLR